MDSKGVLITLYFCFLYYYACHFLTGNWAVRGKYEHHLDMFSLELNWIKTEILNDILNEHRISSGQTFTLPFFSWRLSFLSIAVCILISKQTIVRSKKWCDLWQKMYSKNQKNLLISKKYSINPKLCQFFNPKAFKRWDIELLLLPQNGESVKTFVIITTKL